MKAKVAIDAQQKEIVDFDSFLTKAGTTSMNIDFHMKIMEGIDRMGKQSDL